MRRLWPWVTAGCWLLTGCSAAPRVPPGLPPPEYEQPEPTPWPPAAPTAPSAPSAGASDIEPARTPAELRTDVPATGQAGAPSGE